MTIKGRLLSSTAIVKRFGPKKNKVHPSDRLLFPLEFRNHMWYEEPIVVGLQGWEKSLMIYLSVSIQYRRVTDTQIRDDSKDRASITSRG